MIPVLFSPAISIINNAQRAKVEALMISDPLGEYVRWKDIQETLDTMGHRSLIAGMDETMREHTALISGTPGRKPKCHSPKS